MNFRYRFVAAFAFGFVAACWRRLVSYYMRVTGRLVSYYMRVTGRLVSYYMRVTGRRHWQAVSPYSSLQLGVMSTKEAVRTVWEMGRVSFVDVENGTIIFDAHLVPQQHQEKL